MAAQTALTPTHLSIPGAISRLVSQRRDPQLSLVQSPVAASRLAPTIRRLVVLIPDADTDETELSQHIWSMVGRRELSVLFLGLSRDARHGPRARRRLATLAALTRDASVHVEAKLVIGSDWLQVLHSVHRSGDMVVCHAEQHVLRWGFRREPWSQRLMLALNQPVRILVGFYPDLPPDHVGPFDRLLSLAVPIAIVAAFSGLQILIHLTFTETAYTVLMLASVVAEYGLIGLWRYLLD